MENYSKTSGNGIESYRRKMTPGEMVAIRRKELGMTQEELEYLSDVSVAHIGRIENNKVKPGLEIIEKLEKALGIPLRKEFDEYCPKYSYKRRKKKRKNEQIEKLEEVLQSKGLTEAELDRFWKIVLSELDSFDK